MFPCSPAISIAGMTYRNSYLRNVNHLSHERISNFLHFAGNRLKIGQYLAEIFQNREPDVLHVGKCIACYFDASQGLQNIPSQVCSIAACGRPLQIIAGISPGHTLRCCTPAMGFSKAPAMQQNHLRWPAMHFPTCW